MKTHFLLQLAPDEPQRHDRSAAGLSQMCVALFWCNAGKYKSGDGRNGLEESDHICLSFCGEATS